MGSVEVLPQRGGAPAAEAWRASPSPASGIVKVRPTRLEDYAAIRALQRRASPYLPAWSLRQLESQLHEFPEGQLVAVCDGEIVGAAASLIVKWDEHGLEHSWKSITGDGYFTNHDRAGRTLYGADVIVDTSRHGFGVGRSLFQARRRLCRRLNLRRIIATARLPGYGELAASLSPEQYAMRVIWGDIADPTMRFHMAQGFQYCGVLRAYHPEDEESAGCAALLAWLNPLYAPPRPPAQFESQRARKCA